MIAIPMTLVLSAGAWAQTTAIAGDVRAKTEKASKVRLSRSPAPM